MGDKRTGFAQTEAEVMEQTLTLTVPQSHTVSLRQVVGQELPVPAISAITPGAGRASQVTFHRRQLLLGEPVGPTRSFSFLQPREALALETAHPTLNGTGVLAQPVRHVVAAKAMADEQDSVQAMVVTRVLGASDFLLNRQAHDFNISHLQPAHRTASRLIVGPRGLGKSTQLCGIT